MRVRGDIQNQNYSGHRGVRDDVSTRLLKTLYAGISYKLRVDLVTDFEVILFGDVTQNVPCNFRFWGANNLCEREELLGESGAVTHETWKTYRFCFTPSKNYTYFLLEADYLNSDTTNGMMLVDNLIISPASEFDTVLMLDTLVSGDEPVQLLASESTNYNWFPADGLSCTDCRNPLVNYLGNLTYYVEIENSYGCNDIEKFVIRLPDCNAVTASQSRLVLDTTLNKGESIVLSADRANSYKWTPSEGISCSNCRSVNLTVTKPIQYICRCIDEFECEFFLSYNIALNIFIPNVITPNSDGINDIFEIEELPENSKLTLTDRLGRLIYYSSNYTNNWPGHSPPPELDHTETYWYTLELPWGEVKKGFLLVKP